MAISVVQAVPQVRRVSRRPQHTFKLKTVPWTIQPFMLAPVLPGETMKSAMLQSRVVTAPIKSSLTGWWNEYFFFYVKHRDMELRETLTEMMVDPNWTPSAVKSEVGAPLHYFDGQAGQNWINWSQLCLERVVQEYFRNDGEHHTDFVLEGLPLAQVSGMNWTDSAQLDADYVPREDVQVEAGVGGEIMASEVDKALAMWEFLREQGMTQQTYEEYLATYGIRQQPEEELHKPELVRFVRDWSYPSNTINPATGAASSAVFWDVRERADKDRFFREPGFLYGVTVKRPKVLMRNQSGNAAAIMNDVVAWLPATFAQTAWSSMKQIEAGSGPLSQTSTPYWVDVKDLLLYGDQFSNFDLQTADDQSLVALPTTGLQKRYIPNLQAVTDLFVDPVNFFVREDGIVTLNIASRQRDMTPTT